jgi:hypothetical protein
MHKYLIGLIFCLTIFPSILAAQSGYQKTELDRCLQILQYGQDQYLSEVEVEKYRIEAENGDRKSIFEFLQEKQKTWETLYEIEKRYFSTMMEIREISVDLRELEEQKTETTQTFLSEKTELERWVNPPPEQKKIVPAPTPITGDPIIEESAPKKGSDSPQKNDPLPPAIDKKISPPPVEETPDPLRAQKLSGIGQFLHNEIEPSRPGLEVFQFEKNEKIFAIDFENPLEQTKCFERISHFVEKEPGRILTESQLKDYLRKNGHEYQLADGTKYYLCTAAYDLRAHHLADFFNQVKKQNMKLLEKEKLLQQLLLKNNIIFGEAGNFAGQEDVCVITATNCSEKGWDKKGYFCHEYRHGIYFSDQKYREVCDGFWEKMKNEERRYITLWLKSLGYNAQDNYLIKNEWQAYALGSISLQNFGGDTKNLNQTEKIQYEKYLPSRVNLPGIQDRLKAAIRQAEYGFVIEN